MTVPLGRWPGCIGDFDRNGFLVVEVACPQPALGDAPDDSGVVTVDCADFTVLRVLRATVTHPYLILWLYQELTYDAGRAKPGWFWEGDGPDGLPVTLLLYCDDAGWHVDFTWGTDTITLDSDVVTPLVQPGNYFLLNLATDFTHGGVTAQLGLTVTS